MNKIAWMVKIRGLSASLNENLILRTHNNLFGHHVLNRFAIVGHARTGSNYLLDGLMSSKSVAGYHEIFANHNRTIGENFEKILSQLYRKENKQVSIVGFKLFYNHLTEEEWIKFLTHDEFRILHLSRANRLRTIVSLDIAFKTDSWTRSSKIKTVQLNDKRIALNTSELIGRLKEIQSQEFLARERFRDRPTLEVVYEEMIKNPKNAFQAIGDFLQVNDIDFTKIKIMKQNPEKLDQLINNFDEIHELLKDSEFADCLTD